MKVWIQRDLSDFYDITTGNYSTDYFRRGCLEDAEEVSDAAIALEEDNGRNGIYFASYQINGNNIYFFVEKI